MKAYLNIQLTPVNGVIPCIVVSAAAIHNSPPSSLARCLAGFWSCCIEAEGETFQDAHDKIMEVVWSTPVFSSLRVYLSESQEVHTAKWHVNNPRRD